MKMTFHLVGGAALTPNLCRSSLLLSSAAFHLPTRGPRVGARGGFSISWVGSRLTMQKREKRVRGSGARVGSSSRNTDPRQQAIRFLVGGAAAGAACQGHLLSDLLCSLFLPRHTQAIYSLFLGAAAGGSCRVQHFV